MAESVSSAPPPHPPPTIQSRHLHHFLSQLRPWVEADDWASGTSSVKQQDGTAPPRRPLANCCHRRGGREQIAPPPLQLPSVLILRSGRSRLRRWRGGGGQRQRHRRRPNTSLNGESGEGVKGRVTSASNQPPGSRGEQCSEDISAQFKESPPKS